MIEYGIWLAAGVVIGMTLMAFLGIGTYDRGYDEGFRLRRPMRAELEARHLAMALPLPIEARAA